MNSYESGGHESAQGLGTLFQKSIDFRKRGAQTRRRDTLKHDPPTSANLSKPENPMVIQSLACDPQNQTSTIHLDSVRLVLERILRRDFRCWIAA